jgi:hypothetical protein
MYTQFETSKLLRMLQGEGMDRQFLIDQRDSKPPASAARSHYAEEVRKADKRLDAIKRELEKRGVIL